MNNIKQHGAPEGSGRLESLKQRFTEWRQLTEEVKCMVRNAGKLMWPIQ